MKMIYKVILMCERCPYNIVDNLKEWCSEGYHGREIKDKDKKNAFPDWCPLEGYKEV